MVKKIRAITRSVRVLELIAEYGHLSLNELHRHSGLPRATLLRILETLSADGWLYRSAGDNRYSLSAALTLRTRPPAPEDRLVQTAADILRELQQAISWPSDIAVRDGLRMRILETSRRFALATDHREAMGYQPHMLWSAMGRAYISFCPKRERDELVVALSRSSDPRDRAASVSSWLNRLLKSTWQRGYGVRDDGYYVDGSNASKCVHAIAVPVMRGRSVACSMNVLWLKDAFALEDGVSRYLEPLRQAASQLSQRLQHE
ncbi:MAG TPA: helix-turn-helix domain-containing protein [Gammaproteobacteria bacterium]|nr:helix-turn-helix domain-containing protein [Gammaproteobacteria bacterium]